MKQKLQKLFELVDEQAEDRGLWFTAKLTTNRHGDDKWVPLTIAEAHLQQELRKLHAAVEELREEK